MIKLYNAEDFKKLLSLVADDFDVCISMDNGKTNYEINAVSVDNDSKTVILMNNPTPAF